MTHNIPPNSIFWVDVVLATPAHSALGETLGYVSEVPLTCGSWVRVPLGTRETLAMVWAVYSQAPEHLSGVDCKRVLSVLPIAPMDGAWRDLMRFAASYYQRSLGEVALAAIPPALKDLQVEQVQRQLKKLDKAVAARTTAPAPTPQQAPTLTTEQAQVLDEMAPCKQPMLLFGVTGSGKTEVYLQAAERVLSAQAHSQVLVMVPEINLTPQLLGRFEERLGRFGVVSMHSGLTPAQRLQHWLQAHMGHARIVLGTRMSVFASLPGLQLIVVDEEHDPSYKSQDGARYSARDLAVYRALKQPEAAPCQVLLGSATPSLETWHACEKGRYKRLTLGDRVGQAAWPTLRLVDMHHQPKGAVLATSLMAAISERAQRGEQSLVLLNRRGYAPVIACHDCGWTSDCPHCSAHTVFHKLDRTLRCHHCGYSTRVHKACPECGNLDITPLGKGTEQLQEQLQALLADVRRPNGEPLRIARMDADTTRTKGSLEAQLEHMHSGEVDVLVGTQMVAKGHDFRRITLVASLNTDNGLFASDYRAPERLFALLMQAAGRAGRDAAFVKDQATQVELWVQTWYPQHPLFGALGKHDYALFAAQQLEERQAAQMPPFAFQALLRAEAKTQEAAQAWLRHAQAAGQTLPMASAMTLYPPVPLTVQRVANVERAHLLVESSSRPALQAFLAAWMPLLQPLRQQPDCKGLVRWAIDVDPVSV